MELIHSRFLFAGLHKATMHQTYKLPTKVLPAAAAAAAPPYIMQTSTACEGSVACVVGNRLTVFI